MSMASPNVINKLMSLKRPDRRPALRYAPSKDQSWAHSCCSRAALAAALGDGSISAIETDLVWSESQSAVVHAHPPATASDLPFDAFLDAVCGEDARPAHVKLDFKMPNIVAPCVASIDKYYADALLEKKMALWLNADVLPGPGAPRCAFDADAFCRVCSGIRGAVLSLGWTVDVGLGDAYGDGDVDAMLDLLRRHGDRFARNDTRVVVAANLRFALRSLGVFARLLAASDVEVLFWTGTGEPPVSAAMVARVREGLAAFEERLAFDAQLAPSAALPNAKLALWRLWRKAKNAVAPPPPPPNPDPPRRRAPVCC